jgi:hypothetical protein
MMNKIRIISRRRSFIIHFSSFIIFSFIIHHSSFIIPAAAFGRRDVGTTGAPFLKIGVTPRLAALGEAYGALGDDAGVLYSNPAGLYDARRKEAVFVHAELIADIRLNSLFYVHPLPSPYGVLAVNYTHLGYGTIDRTVINAFGAANPFSTAGTFSARDHLFTIGYGDRFHLGRHRFLWGAAGKIIRLSIAEETAHGMAYDLGLLYAPLDWNWRFGAAIQNLGYLSKFQDVADPLPINLKLSVAGRLFDDRFRPAFDVNIPRDNTAVFNLGVEVAPIKPLALRAGYRWDNNTTDFKGPTAGLGVTLAGITIDYAYVPFELLGTNHRFSLGARWGAEAEREERPRTGPRQPAPAPTAPPATTRPAPSQPSTPTTPVYTPTTPIAPPAPIITAGGIHSAPFIQISGGAEHEWIGAGTMRVLKKHWTNRGIYSHAGPWWVEGDYSVAGNVLTIRASLRNGNRVVGTFESSGEIDEPFLVWIPLMAAIDGRLRSVGVIQR